MAYIPFLKQDGSPFGVLRDQDKIKVFLKDGFKIHVAPEQLERAQLVIHNELMERLLDHLHKKPNNEQAQYEAEQIVLQFWRECLEHGGIGW